MGPADQVNVYRSVIDTCWLVLVVYWAVAAIGAKRTDGRAHRRKGIGVRLALIVLIVLAFRLPPLRQSLLSVQAHLARNAVAGVLGVVLCALGVGLAI